MEWVHYQSLNEAIAEVEKGVRWKTGALLHGPPGNGKSYLARYFALKYRLPVYLVALTPNTDNHHIIGMFNMIKGPAMILMEDFDSYFDGRKCLLNEAQFTLDAILNVLDGTFTSMKGTVTIMTCNDLSKIDLALSRRPGRLRYVIEVPDPSESLREQILNGHPEAAIKAVDAASLDELLALKDELERS
jgi:ATP-dependent 26S proteasome regulatory subunit